MRVNPSFPAPRARWLGYALVTVMAVVSCSKSNQSGNADAGDDAGGGADSGVLDTGLGDDAFIGDDVLIIGDDSSSAYCEIPQGPYTLTLTPASDAGSGGDAGACTPMTSTIDWPLGGMSDGGLHSLNCSLTPDGMPPSCAIHFDCSLRGDTTTTTSQGYVYVFQTTYSGLETVTIDDNAPGMQQLSKCTYDMTLVHQ